ncbi:TonB-dependent receptor [Sphingobium naphthae]|nr:TonB-dependent receptor [Sphingobium naphthae]
MKIWSSLRREMLLGATIIATGFCLDAQAQSGQSRHYDIQEPSLDAALRSLGAQSGREIMVPSDLVAGRTAPRLEGNFRFEDAIRQLLRGTDLIVEFTSEGALIRGRETSVRQEIGQSGDLQSSEIMVTGSRIRGVRSSPGVTISRQEMLKAGQSNLGEALRSLPQNYGGGQNPTVAFGANVMGNGANQNINGSSAANLRGLGPDATLTLLNGHRLSYGNFAQSVDISAIPLAAVSRIEVMTDGGSAIYGSDAVAGVVNIILQPDYSGVSLSSRLSATTEGGGFQQQYGIVTGSRWSDGGFVVTYDYGKDNPVYASSRPFLSYLNAPYTLLPGQRRHSVVLSGHQNLGFGTLKVDGVYNRREQQTLFTYAGRTSRSDADTDTYAASGQLDVPLTDRWEATLLTTFSEERTNSQQRDFVGGVVAYNGRSASLNRVIVGEAGISGELVDLPAGPLKAAIGGGWRGNQFRYGSSSPVIGEQNVVYGYGELEVPLLNRNEGMDELLSLNLAGRYERYRGIDEIFTPKLSVSVRPTDALRLSASWGKSFKAPTLYQLHAVSYRNLLPPFSYGGTGFPAGSTILTSSGGNSDLGPERATNWQVGADWTPLPGLNLNVSYFDIRYKDRVTTPIASRATGLTNPAYQPFITLNPTAAQIEAFLSGDHQFYNGVGTGTSFDPSSVVALIDDSYLNAARQDISGLDASVSYAQPLQGGTLSTTVSATWLKSSRRITGSDQSVKIAGTAFNPASFKARASLGWSSEQASVNGYVNYIDGVDDVRTDAIIKGRSMTTVDVSSEIYFGPTAGLAKHITFRLSAQNLLNQLPPPISEVSGIIYLPNYDSTNYSGIGRTVSAAVTVDF